MRSSSWALTEVRPSSSVMPASSPGPQASSCERARSRSQLGTTKAHSAAHARHRTAVAAPHQTATAVLVCIRGGRPSGIGIEAGEADESQVLVGRRRVSGSEFVFGQTPVERGRRRRRRSLLRIIHARGAIPNERRRRRRRRRRSLLRIRRRRSLLPAVTGEARLTSLSRGAGEGETGCKRKDPGVVKSGCQLVDILLRVRRRKGNAQARCACLHCGGANGGNMHASLEKLPAARRERARAARHVLSVTITTRKGGVSG